MNEQENIRKELESLAPELARLKKPDRREVPEGYFEQLPDEIMQKIKAIDENPAKVRYIYRRWIWRAAAILLIAALGMSIFLYLNQPLGEPKFASLSLEEREAYIEENIHEFEMEMIMETVQVEDLKYDWFVDEPQDEEALDQYLDEMIQDMDLEDFEQLL